VTYPIRVGLRFFPFRIFYDLPDHVVREKNKALFSDAEGEVGCAGIV
jgi:hypothetical protein